MKIMRFVLLLSALLHIGGGCCSLSDGCDVGGGASARNLRDLQHDYYGMLCTFVMIPAPPPLVLYSVGDDDIIEQDRASLLIAYGQPYSSRSYGEGLVVDEFKLSPELILKTCCRSEGQDDSGLLLDADIYMAGERELVSWRFSDLPMMMMSESLFVQKLKLMKAAERQMRNKWRSNKKKEIFLDGRLVRTYYEKEYPGQPVLADRETWQLDGATVCEGVYKRGIYWEGSFFVRDRDDSFREVVFKEGVLQLSMYPDWDPPKEGSANQGARLSGRVGQTKLDEQIFSRYQNFYEILGERPFLEWAETVEVTEGYRVVLSSAFSSAIVFRLILEAKQGAPRLVWSFANDAADSLETMDNEICHGGVALTKAEGKEFREMLIENRFWSDRAFDAPRVFDGCGFSCEGLKDSQYAYRSYSNPKGQASSALPARLLEFIPLEQKKKKFQSSFLTEEEDYMCNVIACIEQSAYVLEFLGHSNMVDRLLNDASPEVVAECVQAAKDIMDHHRFDLLTQCSYDRLIWNSENGLLVCPGVGVVKMSSKRIGEPSPVDRLRYELSLQAGKSYKVPFLLSWAATAAEM